MSIPETITIKCPDCGRKTQVSYPKTAKKIAFTCVYCGKPMKKSVGNALRKKQ